MHNMYMILCNQMAAISKYNVSKESTASIFRILFCPENSGAKIIRRFVTTRIYKIHGVT